MIFEMASCGGCRTCEIACSFAHTGEFNPSAASIQIVERADALGFRVRLIDTAGPDEFVCDGCVELNEPICLQYCERKEDLIKILRTFLKSNEIPKKLTSPDKTDKNEDQPRCDRTSSS